MGTRATIAIKYPDKIKEVYNHWDSYPAWLGKNLYHYFNTVNQVEEIMELGDVSSLYPRLYPTPGLKHTFDNPQKDVSVFYGRDRGEKDCAARVYLLPDEEDKFLNAAQHDFTYVFDVKSNKWYFSEGGCAFRILTAADCRHPIDGKLRNLDFSDSEE